MSNRTKGLWVAVVALMVLVAVPAWSATVPKAKFAKNAGKLDGLDSTAFATAGHAHGAGETMPVVLGSDGDGSGLDADTLDGADTATSSDDGAVYLSNGSGHLPAETVDGASIENITRSIPIPVHELDGAFSVPGHVFPAKTMVGPAPALAFDAATEETVTFGVPIPSTGVGAGNFTLRLTWSIATTSNEVRWGLTARSVGIGAVNTGGETLSHPGEEFTVLATANSRRVTDFSLSTIVDAGETLFVSLFRDANDAADDAVGDAHLHAIEVLYPAEQ